MNYLFPKNFDFDMYRNLNKDLKYLDNVTLKKHYIEYGQYENRIYKLDLPENFDVNEYKELNGDLFNLEAKQHYIKYGQYENRIYKLDLPENFPKDFDVDIYKELNEDLKYFSNIEAKQHYIEYGQYENRIYSNIKIDNILKIKLNGIFDPYSIKYIFKLLSKYYKNIIIDNISPDITIYNQTDININDDKSFKIYFPNCFIYDIHFNYDFYLNIYPEFNGWSYDDILNYFKQFGYNEKRKHFFGNLNLFKFDAIICDGIETFNHSIKKRIITHKNINKLKIIFDEFNELKNYNNINHIFIIPSIGRESLINSINSILDQDYKKWEIIIIFDDKKDKYENYKCTYKDNDKITFLNLENNTLLNNIDGHGRASEVRNFGLEYIKNKNYSNDDFICFLDDDDSISSDYISKINEEINRNNVDCVIFRMSDNNYIIPNINCIDFCKCDVGISFAFRFKILIEDNILFKKNSITEDFDILNEIRENKYKIVISPYCKYFVNNCNKYDSFKFNRVLINDEQYNNKIKLNTTFKGYIINLKDDYDKFFHITKELNEIIGFTNYERFNAIRPTINEVLSCSLIDINKLWQFKTLNNENDMKYTIGATGCKLSHYHLLKQIINRNEDYKYYIIFEDDCTFTEDFKLLETIKYIEENNIDFNILYLSCNLHKEEDFDIISECLLKCKIGAGFTTHAMVFNKKNIPNIIREIENNKVEIDNVYVNHVSNRYVMYPMCGYQRECKSKISVYRELEHGMMKNKTENDEIFYGDFTNKKFIIDKMKNVCK